jgi:3',5'-cyclic AMP phosphodiesterase CpdA
LHKPWHFVAGNHDGFYDHRNPDVLTPEYVVAAIDQRLANPTPVVQQALWSREVAPGVQMIGMDSRIKEDWSGYVGEAQLEWLRQQLDAHRDQLVLIAVHHPLSPLTPHNSRPWWDKFICRNGEEVSQVLDGYPNVKMVISGHHHANRILNSNGRLHITTAALGGYPCIYRTVRLSQTDDGWRTSIQVHTVADPITLERARALMRTSYPARDYIPNAPDAYLTLCEGAPSDQVLDGLIP